MSDNIYNFPKKGFELEVELEEMQEHAEIVRSVQTILEMNISGIVQSSDVDWEHVMDAALSVAMNAGFRAGMSVEELQEFLEGAVLEEFNYDA